MSELGDLKKQQQQYFDEAVKEGKIEKLKRLTYLTGDHLVFSPLYKSTLNFKNLMLVDDQGGGLTVMKGDRLLCSTVEKLYVPGNWDTELIIAVVEAEKKCEGVRLKEEKEWKKGEGELKKQEIKKLEEKLIPQN